MFRTCVGTTRCVGTPTIRTQTCCPTCQPAASPRQLWPRLQLMAKARQLPHRMASEMTIARRHKYILYLDCDVYLSMHETKVFDVQHLFPLLVQSYLQDLQDQLDLNISELFNSPNFKNSLQSINCTSFVYKRWSSIQFSIQTKRHILPT